MAKTARGGVLVSAFEAREETEIKENDERYVIPLSDVSMTFEQGLARVRHAYVTTLVRGSLSTLCIRRRFEPRPRENNPRQLGVVAWVARERETGSGRLEAGRVRPRLESRPGVFGWKQSLGNHPEARRRFTSLSSIHPPVLLYRLQQLHPLASASEIEVFVLQLSHEEIARIR